MRWRMKDQFTRQEQRASQQKNFLQHDHTLRFIAIKIVSPELHFKCFSAASPSFSDCTGVFVINCILICQSSIYSIGESRRFRGSQTDRPGQPDPSSVAEEYGNKISKPARRMQFVGCCCCCCRQAVHLQRQRTPLLWHIVHHLIAFAHSMWPQRIAFSSYTLQCMQLKRGKKKTPQEEEHAVC